VTRPGLGREDIRGLLDDLNDELRRREVHADLFLVGGAAIAVAYDEARSTRGLADVLSCLNEHGWRWSSMREHGGRQSWSRTSRGCRYGVSPRNSAAARQLCSQLFAWAEQRQRSRRGRV
jgi:hypothetical protein